jgi:uncharacterized protein (TIGR04562 family)
MEPGMKQAQSQQELYHEIFGSVLDRTEMTPYLLLNTTGYDYALRQATKMMGNRGFDIYRGGELAAGEERRARKYVDNAYHYCFLHMFPFLKEQFSHLMDLGSENCGLYRECLKSITQINVLLDNKQFRDIIDEDPRHLFLLASSKKYPHVFHGYKRQDMVVPEDWQQMACAVLKVAYLIKSIEEDSQDINDYAQLGLFLEIKGQSLQDLYNFDWADPAHFPDSDAAKKAFVKISTFFLKLKESVKVDIQKNCMVFDSGDGVEIDIAEIKSRLKSPASMSTKLGKDLEGEAHNIRDILAITFILKNSDNTLKLFHALQKRGVILQENVLSSSVTQTLFRNPESMSDAVKSLMISLSKSKGTNDVLDGEHLNSNTKAFYEALSINTDKNPYTSVGHKKLQCKINFSVPVHRSVSTNEILIPGTPEYEGRNRTEKITEQQTLALELRISDEQSWRESEYKEDSHHNAYKLRQLISVMNRIFKDRFHYPESGIARLREDQRKLFM